MVVQPLSSADLNAMPLPSKMAATMLQQFDTLAPQLQRVLECRSTAERLRLAAEHLRRLRQRVRDNDIDVRRLATRVRRH